MSCESLGGHTTEYEECSSASNQTVPQKPDSAFSTISEKCGLCGIELAVQQQACSRNEFGKMLLTNANGAAHYTDSSQYPITLFKPKKRLVSSTHTHSDISVYVALLTALHCWQQRSGGK